MGVIFEARDELVGRRVALKVVRVDKSDSREHLSSLQREARIASRLSGRHLVRLLDVGQEAGRPFMAMEFVDGITLRALLDSEGRATAVRTVAIGAQVARGLSDAHRAGILHRDIKPENIMLARVNRGRERSSTLAWPSPSTLAMTIPDSPCLGRLRARLATWHQRSSAQRPAAAEQVTSTRWV
jgi:serine/threonine protein kinase